MTYPTVQQVVEYIDAARAGQGLTVKEFADLSGLSARTVTAKLAAESPMKVSDLYRFAFALGITPGRVYTDLD